MTEFKIIGYNIDRPTVIDEITCSASGAMLMPRGISNDRPSPAVQGMLRYNTQEHYFEYFSGESNLWLPISLPAPTISSITPNYINYDASGTSETNTNTYTLTGSNFYATPGGISVQVIGSNGTGSILTPNSNTALSETSATFTFDASGTEQLIGISNELTPSFAVKLTNTNSGFSYILNNAIIATNAGPIFTQPSQFNPTVFKTFAVQDPCAHFIVGGIDLSSPTHYPLTFSFASGTGNAGGFNVAGGDIYSISDFSSIVQVPNRLDASATTYNFTMKVTDASSASSLANYSFNLANPTITSIDPSIVSIVDLPEDISINGDYFIRDTNIVLYNQTSGISAEFNDISYNSPTSLTINDLSSNAGAGVYDICVNNFNSPYQFISNKLTITDKFSFTQTGGNVTYLDTVSGLASTISEATASTTSTSSVLITYTSGSGTFVPSSSNFFNVKTQFLVVGGGGGGGASAWTTSGASGGGGGAGEVIEGYMELTNGTTYIISVGNGGTGIGDNQSQNSTNGGNSSFSTYTALGGGYGATTNNGSTNLGGNGGSGGGGAFNGQLSTRSGSSTATHYGNSGGTCSVTSYGAGGGGGASKIGGNATTSLGGVGGDGIELAINGTNTYYGGGGGGGAFYTGGVTYNGGSGGQGGGGAGGTSSGGTGSPGTANTGGGGGGGTYNGSHSGGGNGGSGIVILRFPYWKNLSFTNLNILNITANTGVYDVTYVDSGNNVIFYPKENGYTVVTFKINNGASNGSFTFSPNNNLSTVEYLIIAGGGSGGGGTSDQVGSAGGGAGGYILGINSSGPLTGEQSGGPSTALSPISFSSSVTYSVTVGKGGTGPSANNVGNNGSNSILSGSGLSTITAIGGGGGGDSGGSAGSGKNGGSGGGAGYYASSAGSGTSNQGNNGGKTSGATAGSGGGGGAGGVGQGGTGGPGNPPGIGGSGGNGLQSAIEGPTKYRAGGGGGGSYTTVSHTQATGGTGGSGGGGNGGIAYPNQANEGMNGAANTGSGGGGVSLGRFNTNSDTGGNGGSGVIILRFPSFA